MGWLILVDRPRANVVPEEDPAERICVCPRRTCSYFSKSGCAPKKSNVPKKAFADSAPPHSASTDARVASSSRSNATRLPFRHFANSAEGGRFVFRHAEWIGPIAATRASDFDHLSSIDVPVFALANSHGQSNSYFSESTVNLTWTNSKAPSVRAATTSSRDLNFVSSASSNTHLKSPGSRYCLSSTSIPARS